MKLVQFGPLHDSSRTTRQDTRADKSPARRKIQHGFNVKEHNGPFLLSRRRQETTVFKGRVIRSREVKCSAGETGKRTLIPLNITGSYCREPSGGKCCRLQKKSFMQNKRKECGCSRARRHPPIAPSENRANKKKQKTLGDEVRENSAECRVTPWSHKLKHLHEEIKTQDRKCDRRSLLLIVFILYS